MPHKAPLHLNAAALALNAEMAALAKTLLASSPNIDGAFRETWKALLAVYAHYQQEVIADNGLKPACSRGCAWCCSHWVEDVYSFEALLIAEDLKATLGADELAALRAQLADDEKALVVLHEIMGEKLAAIPEEELSDIDRDELLLASFYQLSRPCPLLDEKSECRAYELRPLTCRAYSNFTEARFCLPSHINETSDIPTYLLEPEEDVSLLLDEVHALFDTTGTTGLRSALGKLLGD